MATTRRYSDANAHAILKKCEPANIEFSNLTYKVMENLKTSKDILRGVSGYFHCGQLTAIIGPSGSGKTTLLNLLAGYRIAPSSGQVNINKAPLKSQQLRKIARYVLQNDLISPFFTIEETLTFASNFKCPPHYTSEKRRAVVKEILNLFRLQERSQVMISEISGGELKRVSIALEMLDHPSLLFLDEPTTGLDETAAMECIVHLKHLAQSGRTIVCSIHSPSGRILHLLDNIYVLAEGQCIYQGKGDHIVPYLQSFQLNCPLTYNPADFIIEVATHEYGNYNLQLVSKIQNGQITSLSVLECSDAGPHKSCDNENLKTLASTVPRLSWWSEYMYILQHNFKQMQRNKANLRLRTLLHLFLSVLVGLCYLGVGKSAELGPFNYHFSLLCSVMCSFVTMAPMLSHVVREMQYLRRQHFNQWYRLGPWFVALLTSQLPIMLVMTCISTALLYVLSGQPLELFRFGLFLTAMLLTTLVGISYGIFMGSRMRLMTALFLGPSILAVGILFSCLSVDMDDMPLIKSILMYSSFVRHSVEGLMSALLLFDRSDLECYDIFCYSSKPQAILNVIGFSDIGFLRAALCLIAFHIVFLAMALMSFRSRLNQLGVLSRNRHYMYLKRIIASKINFGDLGFGS